MKPTPNRIEPRSPKRRTTFLRDGPAARYARARILATPALVLKLLRRTPARPPADPGPGE